MSDVTRILSAIENGDPSAADQLLPLVYEELRKLAAARLSREKPGQTLQPTMLVHEAYLRLVDVNESRQWNGRGHFFAAAAEAMRRILIENAQRKQSERHGGNLRRVQLDTVSPETESRNEELLALDEALSRLEERWPDKARLVKLRYFVGMTIPDAAQALAFRTQLPKDIGLSLAPWLHAQLQNEK